MTTTEMELAPRRHRITMRLADKASRRSRVFYRLMRQICPAATEEQLRAVAAGHTIRLVGTEAQLAIVEDVLYMNGFPAVIENDDEQMSLF